MKLPFVSREQLVVGVSSRTDQAIADEPVVILDETDTPAMRRR